MPADRVLAGDELDRDLPVRLARRYETEDLDFARGQNAGRPAGITDQRCNAGEVRRGADLTECPARRIELHRSGIDVSKLPAGNSDEHPCPRRVIRRLKILPGGPGPAKLGERSPGV